MTKTGKTKLNKTAFYVLSFTWGLPMTLFGCVVALVLTLAGYKSERYGWSRCFRVGNDHWGGFEAGFFFVRDTSHDEYITTHEFGHAIQNCIFGPLMPFIISIPSTARYWHRVRQEKRGVCPGRGYYEIWFEAQASKLGRRYADAIRDDGSKKA